MHNLNRSKKILYFNGALALFIIIWGAWVRLSGSGAGCGDHWPLCNGEVLPLNASYKTFIEFTHRLSSGLFGITVLLQLFFAKKDFARGHQYFVGSLIFLILTVIEALIGAVLVKKGLVVDDSSAMRAWVIGAHLVNTLLLMGAWGFCQHVVSHAEKPFQFFKPTGTQSFLGLGGVALFLLVGAFGAITALGNTLFPSTSLAAGLASDFDAGAPFLIQLRIYHPLLAVGLGIWWFVISHLYQQKDSVSPELKWQGSLRVFVFISLAFGMLNYLLMAPVWTALIHLLLADLFWLSAVGFLSRMHFKARSS